MWDFFSHLWDTQGFASRWQAGGEGTELGLLHVASDLIVGLALLAVAAVPLSIARRRPDLPRTSHWWLLSLVFALAALSHLLEALTYWWPAYRFSALIKLVLAVLTVLVLAQLPRLLAILKLHGQDTLQQHIVGREQAERALRESEALYRSLVESLPLNVFRKDRESRIVFGNSRFCDSLSHPLNQLIGKSDDDLFPPEIAHKYRADDARVINEGLTLDEVEVHPRHDGTLSYVQVLKAPVRNAQGEIVGVQGLFWDVSARELAEEALRESQERLSLALEAAQVGTWSWQSDKDELLLDNRMLSMFGFAAEDRRDSVEAILSRVHPEDIARVRDAMQTATREGRLLDLDFRIVWPDGSMRNLTSSAAVVRAKKGKSVRMMGVCLDVTQRKRAEEDLLFERHLLHSLMDNLPDCVYFKDRDGRYIRINHAFAMRGGLAHPSHARGKTDKHFFSPETALANRYDEHSILKTGNPLVAKEELITWLDGQSMWVAATKMPLADRQGKVVGTFGVSRDITETKRFESELTRAKEAAEDASLAKSAFLANMSHEIRTPMNAILGMTELVLGTPLAQQQREYLNIVRLSGESLLTIIEDVLDFSKIEAGRMTLNPGPILIREHLGDTLKSLAIRAHDKGLELVASIAPSTPALIFGDAVRLRQIVVNLIGNAIKFTEQGEVVLKVWPEEETAAHVALHFAVRDTGMGVPAEQQQTIFGAFEQGDNSTTRKFGGTGLGLAISSRLVSLMDGEIWVESDPQTSTGSTFHFTARFAKVAESESVSNQQTSRTLPADSKGAKVLVMDDNASSRAMLVELLQSWQMIPHGVATLAEARQQIEQARMVQQPYTLVIADAVMPNGGGFDLAEELSRETAVQETVSREKIVLLLASRDSASQFARGEALRVSACLMKPVKQSECFDAISLALSGDSSGMRGESLLPRDTVPVCRPLRVLLAEDSLVNQKLAVGLLQRQGHSVLVAGNGKEALALAESHEPDLILMDVQMPEMDGLEATRRLRAREKQSGRHIPIIAMTAHAMTEDRTMCLEAGMDDYVAKPVRPVELFTAITRLAGELGPRGGVPSASVSSDTSPAAPALDSDSNSAENDPIDWDFAHQAVQGDQQLLREIAEAFLAEAPRLLTELEASLAASDASASRLNAHTLKGSMRYFGAQLAHDVAFQIERRMASKPVEAAAMELSRQELPQLKELVREISHSLMRRLTRRL